MNTLKVIGYIYTDFPTKFGIPRQSGIVNELVGKIIMEPEYRNPEGLKGLEGFSHIWLLWSFSENECDSWSATVKPPRLGGKKRMGVFATRSPFRPNGIGLSCVKLKKIEWDEVKGPILHVSGIDMMNKTPIYDIKPYLPYSDCHPEATGGFAAEVEDYSLKVVFPKELLMVIPERKRDAIQYVLSQDPRPAYHADPERRYGVEFAGYDVRFHVKDKVLTVCEVVVL